MNKHMKVSNFLNKETCDILAGYLLIREEKAPFGSNFNDHDVPGAFSLGRDPLMESLLFYIQPKVEELTGCKLYPTYAYCRIYRGGHSLYRHIDRQSCEISVTLNLKNDGVPWPINIDGENIHLDQGEGAIYLGTKQTHFREPFKGEEHIQVFLHYVRVDGPYAEFKHDKRVDLFNPF